MRTRNLAKLCGLAVGSAAVIVSPRPALAGPDPYIGEMMLVGFNFCPRGWATAEGQLLAISQYTALFSLLGTTYGGDGRTTFGLPDLRGRAPIGYGSGPGLPTVSWGEKGGSTNFTLTVDNLPPHKHDVQATNEFADKPGPGDKLLAADDNGINKYHDGTPNKTMSSDMITETGGGQSVDKRSPFIGMRWCIALEGIFPPRN